MRNIFTEHPRNINETYFTHLLFATKFGLQMIIGGVACLIHAVFPFLFKDTGSNFLLRMIHDFICRMPPDENRIVTLANVIEKKVYAQKKDSLSPTIEIET